MKVVLVVANCSWHGKRSWKSIPAAVPIITAILKGKFNFSVIDANINDYSIEEAKGKIAETRADVILITALSTEYYQIYHSVAKIAKESLPKCKVIMGGVHPTVCPDEVAMDRNVDYVMIGHAEERLDYFLKLLENRMLVDIEAFPGIAYKKEDVIIVNPLEKQIGDVCELVRPDYSLIELDKYLMKERITTNFIQEGKANEVMIITSFGCPYNCLFCATRTISGKKIAYRPIDDVLDELDFFIKEKGADSFMIMDECMLEDRDRALYFFKEIIRRMYNVEFQICNVAAWHLDRELLGLMKTAGVSRLGISVESGCERVLHEIIRKPLKLETIPHLVNICKELDILMTANFVIGFPGETWEEIRESMRFAEKCDFDYVNIHIASILPKTDLYKLAIETKSIPEDFSFFQEDVNCGLCKGNITTDEFSPHELEVIRAYEWDRINFSSIEKQERICRIMGMTREELKEHRKQTRIHCGRYFD